MKALGEPAVELPPFPSAAPPPPERLGRTCLRTSRAQAREPNRRSRLLRRTSGQGFHIGVGSRAGLPSFVWFSRKPRQSRTPISARFTVRVSSGSVNRLCRSISQRCDRSGDRIGRWPNPLLGDPVRSASPSASSRKPPTCRKPRAVDQHLSHLGQVDPSFCASKNAAHERRVRLLLQRPASRPKQRVRAGSPTRSTIHASMPRSLLAVGLEPGCAPQSRAVLSAPQTATPTRAPCGPRPSPRPANDGARVPTVDSKCAAAPPNLGEASILP